MQLKRFKLSFRRHFRKQKRQMTQAGQQAEAGLENHFFKRLDRLVPVRRFVIGWLFLVALLGGCTLAQLNALSGQYQKLEPAPGGTYVEGVLGSFTNANPIYATSEVDTTLSRLVFAGLLKYNQRNQLVGDLASSWSANDKGTVYTVHLKPHLVWQDGAPLTARDVVFTYHLIQNPDAQSPLSSSWQGVQVTAPDANTVTFTLPDPLSSFPYNLTTGILPSHLLGKVSPSEMRSASFNTQNPIGAGPFKWSAVQVSSDSSGSTETEVALAPFKHYNAGPPKLDGFVMRAFASEQPLLASFKSGDLTAAAGLPSLPPSPAKDKKTNVFNMPDSAANMVFFNTAQGVLSDVAVRQALISGTNRRAIINRLGYPTQLVSEPLLSGQLAFDPKYAEANYNPTAAATQLQQSGWQIGKDGLRHKGQQTLSFDLVAANTSENRLVTGVLRSQWRSLGVDARVHLENKADLTGALSSHSYDALLDSIAIGVDPDVFVYWDSSQRSGAGLNFSQYDSQTADTSIEAGRTRLDPELRIVKYQPFLAAWQKDAPALGLYQPRFLYLTNQPVYGLSEHTLNADADRFDNVANWQIREAKVTD